MSERNAIPDSFYSAVTEKLPPTGNISNSRPNSNSAGKPTVPFGAEVEKPDLSQTVLNENIQGKDISKDRRALVQTSTQSFRRKTDAE